MTKNDLVEVVYHRHGGISRKESARIITLILERIKGELADRGRVQISGFGRFEVVRRMPRKGRNPKTGAEIQIDAKRSLVFRPSKVLLDRLNRAA